MFNSFLEKTPHQKKIRELQPWIPFCASRCSFCYFPVNCEAENIQLYIDALKKVLGLYSEKRYVKLCTFNELYVGGGSPTVLSGDQIIDIINYCRENFIFDDRCMTKVAACTSDLDREKIMKLCMGEVDQLDLGVQTFDNSLRKILFLRDKSEDVKSKIRQARALGIKVSIDLLYNLPGQTLQQWIRDVEQAIELDVESVDCYPLDVYPYTPLAEMIKNGKIPPQAGSEEELEMYLEARRIFKENGYFPTCHNRFSRIKEDFEEPASEIIGTGAGFFMGNLGKVLYCDAEDIGEYIKKAKNQIFPIEKILFLSKEQEIIRFMMNICIRRPIDINEFEEKFGKHPKEVFPETLEKLTKEGLVRIEGGKIVLTEKGDPWRFNIIWDFHKEISGGTRS